MFDADKRKSPICLMYVEDEPLTRRIVAGMLAPFDLEIHLAGNGAEGLEMYGNIKPEIVITDVQMPIMNGLEMSRAIREINPQAQIIVVSSHSDTDFLLQAIGIGIKHFVLKPLDMQRLSDVVEDCVVFVQMQRMLTQQNAKIKMLYDAIEQSSDITFIVDKAGCIEYVNKSFCQVTGYEFGEVIGRNCQLLNSGENPAALFAKLWSAVSTGSVWHGEMLNKKKNGEVYWEEMTITPIKNSNGEIIKYLKTGSDVTERRKLVEEVLNARKLETIATFAGGMAHDFNNLLQVIMGNLFMLQTELDPGNVLVQLAADAYKASIRAKELNIKLLAFARQEKAVIETVHLDTLFEEAAELFLRDSGVSVDIMLPADLWPVAADRSQLGQVAGNLLLNAREAMPGGGLIKVRAENLVLQHSNELLLETGLYVRVQITDQGVGIPAENLSRVFDPYFSTKTLASRKGNGLGLAICHTVTKNHGGVIRIESGKDAGATVSIYLPADQPWPNRFRSGSTTTSGKAADRFTAIAADREFTAGPKGESA